MGARGPKCSICVEPRNDAIEADMRAKLTVKALAKKYALGEKALEQHRRLHLAKPKKKPIVVPDVPPPEDTSPKGLAAWHCERIKERMLAAERADAPIKEITALQGQYTNALRHHARLSGALDITEAQIVRSAPWSRVSSIAVEVLCPKCLKAFAEKIRDASEGKS